MGRFFGRRPDRTPAIAKAVRKHLFAGEKVVAGVDIQTPGTASAGMQGGASGAVGATVGTPPRLGGGDYAHAIWVAEASAFGLDADQANRLVFASLVLTTQRLLVLQRSKVTRRIKDVAFEWPVTEIDRISYAGGQHKLVIHRGAQTLTFEVELAPKFLPPVYQELPQRLERAKAQVEAN